jgi:hypothetical protein
MFISYTEMPRADFGLAFSGTFWRTLKSLLKPSFRRLRNLKEGIDFFQIFSYFKPLRAFSLQTQQGLFHPCPWPF